MNLRTIVKKLDEYDRNKDVWSDRKQINFLIDLKIELDELVSNYGDLRTVMSAVNKDHRRLINYLTRENLDVLEYRLKMESLRKPLNEVANHLNSLLNRLDKVEKWGDELNPIFDEHWAVVRNIGVTLSSHGLNITRNRPRLLTAKKWLDTNYELIKAVDNEDLLKVQELTDRLFNTDQTYLATNLHSVMHR